MHLDLDVRATMVPELVMAHVQRQQQEMRTSLTQMWRYWEQGVGSYFLREVAAQQWWAGQVEPQLFSEGRAKIILLGKPVTGKTNALGEAAELNADPDFQSRSLDATGKLTKVHVIKAATTAADLGQIWDPTGRRIVDNISHSWTPWQRDIILWTKDQAVGRAYDRLPEEDPSYNHLIVDETLIGFVVRRRIGTKRGGKVVDLVQARLATERATDEGNAQRDQLPKVKNANNVYKKIGGGSLDRSRIPAAKVENRMGDREAWRRQEAALKNAVKEWLAQMGVGPHHRAEIDNPDPKIQQRFNETIMRGFYEYWLDIQGVEPERRVIVPNTYVSAEEGQPKGYWWGLIEHYTLHINKYVTQPEILKARSWLALAA